MSCGIMHATLNIFHEPGYAGSKAPMVNTYIIPKVRHNIAPLPSVPLHFGVLISLTYTVALKKRTNYYFRCIRRGKLSLLCIL